MKKKIIWMLVSFSMVLSLVVITSCGTKEEAKVTEEVRQVVTTKEKEEKSAEVLIPTEEEPQYGGTLTTIYALDAISFAPEDAMASVDEFNSFTHSTLMMIDWWVDRAINPLISGYSNLPQLWTGYLAESWETPDPLTIIFHLRHGVHWQNKPPVNGRELVANDVVWYFDWIRASPKFANHAFQTIESATASDKYTVVFKLKSMNIKMLQTIGGLGQYAHIMAHEVFENYGNFRDWETVVGTGPWMLVDYVPGSSLTYKRNPDYFMKDPKGRNLPYLDGVNRLIILDSVTQMAALRTRKIDLVPGGGAGEARVSWDQKPNLERTNPELLWQKRAGTSWFISPRNDVEPFTDIRVRKALSAAINYQEIAQETFGGNADLYNIPIDSSWDIYIPPEQLPEDVREWYWNYNPKRAKELLAEAGYPNGFKTTVDYSVTGAQACFAEAMELVQAYWKDIGVELVLQPRDAGTYASMKYGFTYQHIIAGEMGWGDPISGLEIFYLSTGRFNRCRVNDPYIDQSYYKAVATFDYTERTKLLKEVYLYILKQCYGLSLPRLNNYSAWYPWIVNYHGEGSLGGSGMGTLFSYLWMNRDMKKAMTQGK